MKEADTSKTCSGFVLPSYVDFKQSVLWDRNIYVPQKNKINVKEEKIHTQTVFGAP